MYLFAVQIEAVPTSMLFEAIETTFVQVAREYLAHFLDSSVESPMHIRSTDNLIPIIYTRKPRL